MDEVMVSVDMWVDSQIQDTMHIHFKANTELTIAHRLDKVMCCDRVMVLGSGRVLEIGSPSDLANDPMSVFHSMVVDPNAKEEIHS
jgi:ABC-type multidrug transport system fused ATPase/permease subunit